MVCGPQGADFRPVLHALTTVLEDAIVVSVDDFEDAWLRVAGSMDDIQDRIENWPGDVDKIVEVIRDADTLPDIARLKPLKIALLKVATDYALELADDGHDCILVGAMDEEDRDFVLREYEMKFDSVEASKEASAAAKEAYLAWDTCVENMHVLLDLIVTGKGDAASAARECVANMELALKATMTAAEAAEYDRQGSAAPWAAEHEVTAMSIDDYGDAESAVDDDLVTLCNMAMDAAINAEAAAVRSLDDDGSFSVQASDAAKVALAAAMCVNDALSGHDVLELIEHVDDIVDNGADAQEGGAENVTLIFVEAYEDVEGYAGMHDSDRLDTPTVVALGDHGYAIVDLSKDPVLVESTLNDSALEAALQGANDVDMSDELDYVQPDEDDVWDGVMGHMMH